MHKRGLNLRETSQAKLSRKLAKKASGKSDNAEAMGLVSVRVRVNAVLSAA